MPSGGSCFFCSSWCWTGSCFNQRYPYIRPIFLLARVCSCIICFLSFPAVVCCNVHHHHLLFLLFLLLFLLLLLRSSALEDSIKQYEQDLARKLYQSRQWAPAPGARPAQMSSAMQSHASRTPGSGSQSRCAQPLPCWLHVCVPTSQHSAPSCGLPGVGRKH